MKNRPKHEPDVNGVPAHKVRKFLDRFPERQYYRSLRITPTYYVNFYQDKDLKKFARDEKGFMPWGILFLVKWEFYISGVSSAMAKACVIVDDQVFWMVTPMAMFYNDHDFEHVPMEDLDSEDGRDIIQE